MGPVVSESAHKPFKCGISVSYSLMVLLDVNSIDFQSQMYWGLICLVQFPRAMVPDVGH